MVTVAMRRGEDHVLPPSVDFENNVADMGATAFPIRPLAVHPGYIRRAVSADGYAGKIILLRVFLDSVDRCLPPSDAAIGRMRNNNLVLRTLMRPHYPGNIQAIHPVAGLAGIDCHRGLKRKSLAWAGQGPSWLGPVVSIG